MKKFAMAIGLLLVSGIALGAQAGTDNLSDVACYGTHAEIAGDDGSVIAHAGNGAFVSINKKHGAKLLAFLEVQKGPGDPNHLVATVKVVNIGDRLSANTKVRLENIPADWNVTGGGFANIGNLKGGSSKAATFDIMKSASDASVYAVASSNNAPAVSSEIVPMPINPIVGIGLVAGIAGLLSVARKSEA